MTTNSKGFQTNKKSALKFKQALRMLTKLKKYKKSLGNTQKFPTLFLQINNKKYPFKRGGTPLNKTGRVATIGSML